MNDAPLDRWRDRMVAALYDELEPEERRELDEAVAADQELQHEWQELLEARRLLAALDAGSAGGAEARWHVEAPPAMRRGVAGRRAWLGLATAAGFFLAAALFVTMLVAGLRVDRTPAGLLVHFGPAHRVDQQPEEAAITLPAPDSTAGRPELTRDELAAFGQVLLATTDARLDELERRQTDAQLMLTQALYESLARSQQRHYDDLRDRIELATYQTASLAPYVVRPRRGYPPVEQGGQR